MILTAEQMQALLRDALIKIYALEEALIRTGKLTGDDLATFRAVAEDMVDQKLRHTSQGTSHDEP